jgi:hypothetical protein
LLFWSNRLTILFVKSLSIGEAKPSLCDLVEKASRGQIAAYIAVAKSRGAELFSRDSVILKRAGKAGITVKP